ncbi:uncharacterized protein B0H18DRAFT_994372 [Fomitopsis serialis]|uniref:uncharacterized protein n=1 Tax=Fomitopsis serialis TaxID=139415 RepID=UPI0020071ECB|nr:uncharacterized protein B0H18DRAFT_994372 [Neoantrodia serialis]KAH9930316.1 hypothetical protein B0H18DRAFT_994372 [Neoantrodia serialis]
MAVRTSRSPVRVDGQRHLASLPIEVYMLIVDEILNEVDDGSSVGYKTVLSNLNLVCRLFANLVTPKLFARLTIASPPSKELKRTHGARTAWLKQLARGDKAAVELAAMVRELELHGCTSAEGGRHPATIESPSWRHAQILTYFPTLRSLTLVQTVVSCEFFVAMKSLGHLRSLSIRHCSFAPLTGHCKPLHYSMKLEHFDAFVLDGVDPYVAALSSMIQGSYIRSLKATEWPLARAILQGMSECRLEQLDISFDPHDSAVLFGFLAGAGTISDLSLVSTLDGDERPSPHAAPSRISLPRLKTLRCPLNLLPVLFPGGAVSCLSVVDICDWFSPSVSTDDRLLLPLEHSQLRELEIPAWVFYHYPVHQYAPTVATLSICFDLLTYSTPLEQLVRDICALGRTSRLTGLNLRFVNAIWRLNLPLQHKMIAQYLMPACPVAKRISFDDAIDWQREPSSSKWKPVVRAREPIKALLRTQPDVRQMMQVMDFEGALAGILDGEIDLSVLS